MIGPDGHLHPSTPALIRIPFFDRELLAIAGFVEDEGDRLVPIRPVCDWLGVSLSSQLSRLKRWEWGHLVNAKAQLPGDNQVRAVACVPLRIVPMWLFTLRLERARPEVQPWLERFQEEATAALLQEGPSLWAAATAECPLPDPPPPPSQTRPSQSAGQGADPELRDRLGALEAQLAALIDRDATREQQLASMRPELKMMHLLETRQAVLEAQARAQTGALEGLRQQQQQLQARLEKQGQTLRTVYERQQVDRIELREQLAASEAASKTREAAHERRLQWLGQLIGVPRGGTSVPQGTYVADVDPKTEHYDVEAVRVVTVRAWLDACTRPLSGKDRGQPLSKRGTGAPEVAASFHKWLAQDDWEPMTTRQLYEALKRAGVVQWGSGESTRYAFTLKPSRALESGPGSTSGAS